MIPGQQARPRPPEIALRVAWEGWGWNESPWRMLERWETAMAHVDEVTAMCEAQIKPLLAELDDTKDRATRAELQDLISEWRGCHGWLHAAYESTLEQYFDDLWDKGAFAARADGASDDQAEAVADLFMEISQPVRPMIEWNHSWTIRYLWWMAAREVLGEDRGKWPVGHRVRLLNYRGKKARRQGTVNRRNRLGFPVCTLDDGTETYVTPFSVERIDV